MARTTPAQGYNSTRLLCLDVDGTLVSETGALYEESIRLLRVANEERFTVALCSARPVRSLIDLARNLSAIRFLCALQGALIAERHDLSSDRRFHTIFVAPPFGGAVINTIRMLLADAQDTEIWTFGPSEWYVKFHSTLVAQEESITRVEPQIIVDPLRACYEPPINLSSLGSKRQMKAAKWSPAKVAGRRS